MVTIKDIAREAGVSVSAVSYALNNSGAVSEEKRKQILALAHKYNYTPNKAAQSLKKQRTKTIGVITNLSRFEMGRMIVNGIAGRCVSEQYNLLLVNELGDINASIEVLLGNQVEGIIYVNNIVEEFPQQFELNIPIVYAYCYKKNGNPCVVPDDVQGGYAATKYLLQLGHTRIGCLTGPADWKATNDRLLGYQKALNESDIYFDVSLVKAGDWGNLEWNKQCAVDLLTQECRPTAIFAFNDVIAASVYHAARQLNLNIPADLSVIGYDNRNFAQYLLPTLTTVMIPFEQIGKTAADLLFTKINAPQSKLPNIRYIDCETIERDSSSKI